MRKNIMMRMMVRLRGKRKRMMLQVTRKVMKSLQADLNSGLVPGLMTWPSKMSTR